MPHASAPRSHGALSATEQSSTDRRARKRIRLAIFDVDGVLTDGTLYLTDGGEEIKAFNMLDGLGHEDAAESGVEIGILSGRKSRDGRAAREGTRHRTCCRASSDKLAGLRSAAQRARLIADGDRLHGRRPGRSAGAAPLRARAHRAGSAAHRRAARALRDASARRRGAVREACELIMRAQGTLDARLTGLPAMNDSTDQRGLR